MAENTIIHEISLAGYKATSTGGMLDLGTWGSYGIEKLHLTLDAAWQDLTITAFFNVKGKVVAKNVVGKDGYADVPWEATKESTFAGRIVFEGSINGQRRITTDLNYKVTNHSEITDIDPVPTDDRWNQFVTETKEYRDGAFEAAKRANARAEDAEAASEDAQAAMRAAKASEDAAVASEIAAKNSGDKAKASADAAAVSESNANASERAAASSAAAAATSEGNAAESAKNAASAAKKAADESVAANIATIEKMQTDVANKQAAAAASEKAAAASAVAAAGSAAQAEAQETAAAKSASDAQAYMQTASAAATAANASAENAAGSKAAAGNSASAAVGSEQAAGASEVKAAESERAAKASEQAAAKSAQAALESKTAAATSEVNAAASAKKAQDVADSLPADYVTAVNDIATLKQQVANITPDDSAIGDKPWSSKHIIDMLCPPLEESGNPVVCYPVAGYPLGVKASWEPMQEGSGTPYPAGGGKNLFDFSRVTDSDVYILDYKKGTITISGNVNNAGYLDSLADLCPGISAGTYIITAKTSNSEALRGIYILDTQKFLEFGQPYDLTENDINGMLSWYNNPNSANSNTISEIQVVAGSTVPTQYYPYENIRPIKGRDSVMVERCGANLSKISDISTPNKSLTPVELPTEIVADIEISFDTLNAEIKNVGTAFFLNKADGKWKAITVQDFGISTAGKIPNGRKTAVFHGVTFKTVETVIIKNGYCGWSGDVNNFCVSIIQNAPYKPYIGQTNTLTLPETVYGGEVDAVRGESSRTWRTITLTGEENSHIFSKLFYIDYLKDSSFVVEKPVDLTTGKSSHYPYTTYSNGYIGITKDGYSVVYGAESKYPISDEGMQEWKAYLAAQYAAGTPVQVCYKLAEPVPFTATGAQPMPALAGANTVLTDADSATVTGRADPIKRITDLEDAVASQT